MARSPSQLLLAERITGLAGVVDEAAFTPLVGDRLIDLRAHPLQRDYWWGSPEFEARFGPLNINEIIERICVDLGVRADFSRPTPLEAYPRNDLDRTVVLVPETDGSAKSWRADRWVALASLLRGDGFEVARLSRGNEMPPLDDIDVRPLVASTPPEAVDILSGCRAAIGIDTGLTHIAAQQGIPTVTICRLRSVYVRPWPHCVALRGSNCTEPCLAVEVSYAYNQRVSLRDFLPAPRSCPSGSACLAGTRPEDAHALLRGLL